MKLTEWKVVEDFCACRLDSDGRTIAFIEKTPRVWNGETWIYGPKGVGGTDAEKNGVYGFYPPSREWADAELVKLGYTL